MKKLAVLILVLGLAATANAALELILMGPGEIAIVGDGETAPGQFYLGATAGSGLTFDISGATINYGGNSAGIDWIDDTDIAAILGVNNPFVGVELNDVPPVGSPQAALEGLLVSNISATGFGWPYLFDGEGNILNTVYFPEPATLALLGLGGLFIRRK